MSCAVRPSRSDSQYHLCIPNSGDLQGELRADHQSPGLDPLDLRVMGDVELRDESY